MLIELEQGLSLPRGAIPGEIGVILNGRAHRNRGGERPARPPLRSIHWARPQSPGQLAQALKRFARARIETLVIDGGDGTLRDVLSAAPACFAAGLPRIALVPSGKTNALARDLGIPRRWGLEDAIAATARPSLGRRCPLELTRAGQVAPFAHGFLFGAGAFVEATMLGQAAHRAGAFGNLAVGMAVASAIGQTSFGGRVNPWRQGEAMAVWLDGGEQHRAPLYLAMISTLERFPLALRPFGPPRPGLKYLGMAAPPRWALVKLAGMLFGLAGYAVNRWGIRCCDPATLRIAPERFVLDGEVFAGGPLIVRAGSPIDFVVP